MIIVTLKYVLLILRVDNHGEGGIMALVALIERVIKSRRKAAWSWSASSGRRSSTATAC